MNITLKEYPQFATAHELIKEFEVAVIAGGCPRDLLAGKPYSDIDIFVPIHSEQQHLVEQTLKAAKFAYDRNLTTELKTYYIFDNGIVIRLRIGDNIDVCFVPGHAFEWGDKKPPMSLFNNFDFVCCQAWLERTEDGFIAHSTELFNALNNRKILGFYPDRGSLNSNHAEKILAKYPDYLVLKLISPKQKRPKQYDDDEQYDDSIPF